MGYTYHTMSLLPYGYARGYGYPGAYPYGPYGMTAEEIGKIREAEEKAFTEAEEKRKELMEKLGPYAYGPYGAAGPFGYGYGAGYGGGYGYGAPHGYWGRGYGYGFPRW